MLNLKYLQQFVELSKSTSMNQYAAKINGTHAQVSKLVMTLEKEFGHKLILRDKKRATIELTDKGQVLLKRIPYLFNEISLMRAIINTDEELEIGNFDLYTTLHLIDYWIAPKLNIFSEDNPHITLNLFGREDTPTHDEKRTLLTVSPKTEGDDTIEQVLLKNYHIGLWASKGYLEKYGRPSNVVDLAHHKIICFERNWNKRAYPTMNWYMNNTDIQLKHEDVHIIRSSVGVMKAAEGGMGIFSLSEESIEILGMSFERVLPDLEGPVVPMCFSYPKAWKNHKSLQIIKNFLIELFKD